MTNQLGFMNVKVLPDGDVSAIKPSGSRQNNNKIHTTRPVRFVPYPIYSEPRYQVQSSRRPIPNIGRY